MYHGHSYVANLLSSALVHFRGLLYALLLQPAAEFRVAYCFRIELPGDFNRIADVVSVTVSDQHDIQDFHIFFGIRAHGISLDPGIHQNRLACWSLYAEGGVPKP